MELEHELSALELAWPPTPEFRLALARRVRGRRRPLLVAVALALDALAAALAVPQSRGAILRFFHLGGETVQIVERLPAAEERPLGAALGPVVGPAEARTRVEPVSVNGAYGLWLSGGAHVVLFPQAPPRVAGNVLVWTRGNTSYRLEGHGLSKRR